STEPPITKEEKEARTGNQCAEQRKHCPWAIAPVPVAKPSQSPKRPMDQASVGQISGDPREFRKCGLGDHAKDHVREKGEHDREQNSCPKWRAHLSGAGP